MTRVAEKEIEKREWQSVLNSPIENIVEVVDSIIEKIKNSEFKRRMPKIAFIRDRV